MTVKERKDLWPGPGFSFGFKNDCETGVLPKYLLNGSLWPRSGRHSLSYAVFWILCSLIANITEFQRRLLQISSLLMVLYTEISDQTFLYIFSSRFWSIKSFKTLSECESRIVGRSPNFA